MSLLRFSATGVRRRKLKQIGEPRCSSVCISLTHKTPPKTPEDISIWEVAPAYIISELKTAFEIGFIIFVPFIVLDLIVANILLALGMMMLSPTIISLPFKLLLFIAVDGWSMIVQGLVTSFN